MSRQISFFHSERDLQKFIEVVDCNGGLIVFNDELVPPKLIIDIVIQKMQTHSCKFGIVPSQLTSIWSKSYSDAATIEFNNCCRGNKLSRTYEAGRLYVVPTDKGSYINETSELYDALRKYIKSSYHYERLAGFYFSLDFWEKYCTHYYYATLAGIPI